MIFRQWEKVLDGTKTQTRRLIATGDHAVDSCDYLATDQDRINTVYNKNGKTKWMVGRTYAVQPGRGKKAVGRIRLTEIRRERLQDISEEDARAEGACIPGIVTEMSHIVFDYRVGFQLLWNKIHKKPPYRWEDNPEVWVLSFVLVEAQNGAHN